tara:strand:+ start:946 stop:1524 length:579 start_codon:yes stop_codon:yes gene_type:complete
MSEVYTDYFQKSKIFLYPLLKIKKGLNFVPKQTYVCWEHVCSVDDFKFLCLYNYKDEEKFHKFIMKTFKNHPLFDDLIKLSDTSALVIFDFITLKNDYKRFINGQYSKLSLDTKITIIDFFGQNTTIHECIQGFLSPEEVHELYAKNLQVDIKLIKEIYEVCSKPNLKKETIVDNNYIIYQLLQKESISLIK